MTRIDRNWIVLAGIALVVVLAGCAGGGTPTPAADVAGDGNGGDDGGSDSGAETNESAATPTSTATPTVTPTPTPTATPTPNATGGTTTPEPLPRMSELLTLDDSYRYEGEVQSSEGTITQEGRIHGSDFVARLAYPQREGTFTVYNVGDREAYVTDEGCFSQDVPDSNDPGNWSDADYLTDIDSRPVNTTTIDGETVYVYETDEAPPELEAPITFYVSAETGYIRRQVTPNLRIDYYDWGHDDSVELPC